MRLFKRLALDKNQRVIISVTVTVTARSVHQALSLSSLFSYSPHVLRYESYFGAKELFQFLHVNPGPA